MHIAPKPILIAANRTVALACAHVRNQTLTDKVSTKMINQLMEAVHDIPNQVCNWREGSLDMLREHLTGFDHALWNDSPNFLDIFEQILDEQSKH